MEPMEHDVQGWRRWIPVLVGLGLTSLIFWFAQHAIASPRGATGPSVLLAEHPIIAIGVLLVCLIFAGGVSIAVGRMVNAVTGLFVLGWGLAILTMRCATMKEVAFEDASAGVLVVEAVLFAGVILGTTWLMFKLAGMPYDIEADPDDPSSLDLFSAQSLKCAAAGLLIIPAIWIVAQSEMKGQVVAAATLGSLAAGLAGRLIAPHSSPILLFAAPCLFGAVGLMIGVMSTTGPLDTAFVAGTVSRFLLVSPLDLAAGSLMGVALGVGWAKSFLQHQPVPA